MESSELLSPNIIKKLIISRHLKDLDEKRMANFKKALCQLKPRRGAGLIKMENLKNKSIEEIVDFIFRCHTERRGASTVIKTLKEINENQIRTSIEKALRDDSKNRKIMETKINEAFQSFNNMETEKTEDIQYSKNMETEKAEAVQCSKNMDTEKNEASTSKVIKVKQDDNQLFKIASITLVPACDAVPCSEPPSKKLKRDQEGNAVPGSSTHREATTSKNEGDSPVHHLPKEEPQPQVSPEQSNITNTISHTAPNKQLGGAPSHTSSKELKLKETRTGNASSPTEPLMKQEENAENKGMPPTYLTDALTCLCADIFTNPVTLPCGHTYCMACIKKTWENQHEREASCPDCRKPYLRKPELNRNVRLCELVEAHKLQQEDASHNTR